MDERETQYRRVVTAGEGWDWGGLYEVERQDQGPTEAFLVVALSPAGARKVAVAESPDTAWGDVRLVAELTRHGFLSYGPGAYEDRVAIADAARSTTNKS